MSILSTAYASPYLHQTQYISYLVSYLYIKVDTLRWTHLVSVEISTQAYICCVKILLHIKNNIIIFIDFVGTAKSSPRQKVCPQCLSRSMLRNRSPRRAPQHLRMSAMSDIKATKWQQPTNNTGVAPISY